MKKTFIIAAALVAMTACNKTLIEAPTAEEFGYINLGVTADTEMVITKATVSDEELDKYTVKVMKVVSGGDQQVTTDASNQTLPTTYGEFKGKSYKIAAGNYYLVAENMTAALAHPNDAKGSKHISGTSETVTLAPGGTQGLNVECKVINSAVTVNFADGFTTTFENAEVVVSEGTRSYKFGESGTLGHDNPVFFPANNEESNGSKVYYANLSMSISANIAGTPKTYTLNRKAYRANWNKVTLAAGENGTITITITADDALNPQDLETITIDPTLADGSTIQ